MTYGGVAERLKVRAFLEGVEVPVIAVQTQTAPNSPTVASIQVPPLAEGMEILPRSIVHVFFDDASFIPDITHMHQVRQRPGGDGYELERDMVSAGYRVMFIGEVVGFAWHKQSYQRTLVLQCMDLSCYWDTAYQWVNTDLFGPGYKAMFSGGGTDLFTNFLASPGEVVSATVQAGIRNGTWQYPKLKGLMGGIVHLLERVGGAYFAEGGKKYRGSNLFFSLAELRLHITQMIGAYDKDPTAQRLLGGSWDGLFGRSIGNLGDHVSIRSVINALMPIVFHETYAQPSPYYTPGTNGTVSGYARTTYGDDPSLKVFASQATQFAEGISQLLEMINSGESLKSLSIKISQLANECRKQANFMNSTMLSSGRAKFAAAASALGSAAAVAKAAGAAGSVNAAAQASIKRATGSMNSARDSLLAVPNLSVSKGDKKEVVPARVWNQIFRPDVWFSAPPKCNVIFPDEVTDFQYNRQFLQEPTRLMLKTNDEFFGEDELFDKLYFAPYQEGLKSNRKSLMSILQGDIFTHELYTGILPVMEKMSEYNIFAARAGVVNGAGAKVGTAQRTTNFLFFKHRFEQRTASVAMRFKPYIACGFPCLVIDSYLDEDKLNRQQELIKQLGRVPPELSKYFGAHILGNAAEVTHSADQATGGATSISLNYCRKIDEKVEFLGAMTGTQRLEWVKGMDDVVRYTDVAAISPPRPGSLGPMYGEVVSVVEVTNQYLPGDREDFTTYKKLKMYMSRRAGSGNLPEVYVGCSLAASVYGEPVTSMFDDPNAIVRFRAFRVSERIPRYKREASDMPAEELIRPGWYGDCWHPGKIGEVYQEFFGIGSITDPVRVTDPEGPAGIYPTGTDNVQPVMMLPDKTTTLKDGTVVNQVSVKDAVEFLTRVYSYVKKNNLNVADFIHSYTWRPIMSMPEVMGSHNLQFEVNGRSMRAKYGREGFHSRSFGDYEDVFLLVPPEVDEVLGIRRSSNDNLFALKGDTRRAKRRAVQEYLTALFYSSATLG